MPDDTSKPPALLTRCATCGAHSRTHAHDGACPFCGASREPSSLLRAARGVAQSGRSGLLAASLLGMTLVGGCADDEDRTPTDTASADANADANASSGGVDGFSSAYGAPPLDGNSSTGGDATSDVDTGNVSSSSGVDGFSSAYGSPPLDGGSSGAP